MYAVDTPLFEDEKSNDDFTEVSFFFLVLFIYLFSPNADGPLKLLFRLFVSLVHQFQGTLMESNQAELT
jgi:hypothetical protein